MHFPVEYVPLYEESLCELSMGLLCSKECTRLEEEGTD